MVIVSVLVTCVYKKMFTPIRGRFRFWPILTWKNDHHSCKKSISASFCIFEVWILTQWSHACETTGEFASPGAVGCEGGRWAPLTNLILTPESAATQATGFEDDLILSQTHMIISICFYDIEKHWYECVEKSTLIEYTTIAGLESPEMTGGTWDAFVFFVVMFPFFPVIMLPVKEPHSKGEWTKVVLMSLECLSAWTGWNTVQRIYVVPFSIILEHMMFFWLSNLIERSTQLKFLVSWISWSLQPS